jgi:hypothetical protein
VHYLVYPFSAEDTCEDVAQGIGDIEQTHDDGFKVVRGSREGGFDTDVEAVERAEGNRSIVDGESYRRI